MLQLNPYSDNSMQRYSQYVAEQEELEALRESYNIDKEDYKTVDYKTQCIIKTNQGISAVGEVPTSNRDYYLSFKAAIVNLKETLDKLDAANARHDFMTTKEIDDEHQRLIQDHKIINVNYELVRNPAASIQLMKCLITTENGKEFEGQAMGLVLGDLEHRSFENAILELENRNRAIDRLDNSMTINKESKKDMVEETHSVDMLDVNEPQNEDRTLSPLEIEEMNSMRDKWRISGEEYYEKGDEVLCVINMPYGDIKQVVGHGANEKESFYEAIAIIEAISRVVSTDNQGNKHGNIAAEVNPFDLKVSPYDVINDQFIHMGKHATVCILKTRCGYEATGVTYCYDPKAFDDQIGIDESRKNAMENLQGFIAYCQKHDDGKNERMESPRTIYQTFEDSTITACCLIDGKGFATVDFSDSKSSNPSEVITKIECLQMSYEQYYYSSKYVEKASR